MKKMKNVPFLALLFLLLFIGSSSFLQAQITYCLEFEATADCNNATVEVFLVHDAPNPTLDIGGIPHFYIAGDINFTYDPTILSNPVLTSDGFWGNGFLSTSLTSPDVLRFNFNPGDFIEYQFMQRVRVFTITFDHSTSLECVELAFNGQGTFPSTSLYTTSNQVLTEGFLEVALLCIPECNANRLAVETDNTENNSSNTIIAYPNPVEDSDISLSIENAIEGEREISVVDMNGKVVFHKEYSGEILQIQLPSSEWSAGIYIVSSTNKSEKLTTRFIIK